jgi:predicted membrane metal-binding protein
MVFEKSLSRAFNKVPAFFREGLTTSLAAQIGVAPILYYVFGYIFILSPIVNMLVLWTVSYISLLGSLAGLVGVLYQPLGRGILYLSFPFTSWFIWVIELFS